MKEFKAMYANYVVVGKVAPMAGLVLLNEFEDLSRFGVFRLRTEHELFFRSLLGQDFGPPKRAGARREVDAKDVKKKKKKQTKRTMDLASATAILLTGKPPEDQGVLDDIGAPDTDSDAETDSADESCNEADEEAIGGILQCAVCKVRRHVGRQLFDFYSKPGMVFNCHIVSEQCRGKLQRRR